MKNYLLVFGLIFINFTVQSQETFWILSKTISSKSSKEDYRKHNQMLVKISKDSIGFFTTKDLSANQNYGFSYHTKGSNLIIKNSDSNTHGLGYYINDSIFEFTSFNRTMIFQKVKPSSVQMTQTDIQNLIRKNYYSFSDWERNKVDTVAFASNCKMGVVRNIPLETVNLENNIFFILYDKILPLSAIDKKQLDFLVYDEDQQDLIFQKIKLSKKELKNLADQKSKVAIEMQ